MKKLLVFSAIFLCGIDAYAATARSAVSASSARGGVGRNVVTTVPTATPTPQTRTVATRGVSPTTAVSTSQSAQTVARGRSATAPVSNARAAKQSVISSGTKVAAAAQNTAVDQVCWEKFNGCMDSFCMLDNANGGRCICSDKNAEYDSILAEIQSLDEQSYQLATVGVERIEMGDGADAVMSKMNAVTKSVEKDNAREKSKRQLLDLTAWNSDSFDFDSDVDVDDMFSVSADGMSVQNKTGDALFRVSAKLCNAQIPECESQAKMMELMYQQRVRSDCTAYENSLRQQRTQSAQKLAAAQSAMREAALEQYRNANKYDLGQCTVQFKQCMQTTGGCGDDFSGCVEWSVREGLVNKDQTSQTIKGTTSKIELSGATYDVLLGKKELCMSVTQQCVNVRDQVWDTFLREVAPQVKSAELVAESNMRTSCISNIAACFQKACRDNIDPNDPDGSYDMCLTRPDTLGDVCKVEIEPCQGTNEKIMDYVYARLASMRVDSCTKEFKSCLTSEDRCGKDYSQCVGLDTATIVALCPPEKLVGCQKDGKSVYDELTQIAQGIFLNIDNSMLAQCQKAADAAMIKVCGSTENCDGLVVDDGLGARSLEYKICQVRSSSDIGSSTPGATSRITPLTSIDYNSCIPNTDMISDTDLGRSSAQIGGTTTKNQPKNWVAIIDGMIYWESVVVNDINAKKTNADYDAYGKLISISDYLDALGVDKTDLTDNQLERITRELASLQTSINNAISTIESDTMVRYCKQGRGDSWRTTTGDGEDAGRFPHLTDQMRQIITTSALAKTKENYYAKYDELNNKMLQDYSNIAERVAVINGKNEKDSYRDASRLACLNMADASGLARSAKPPKSGVAAAAIAGGMSGFTPGGIIAAGVTLAGMMLNNAESDDANGESKGYLNHNKNSLVASNEVGQWNYKETITTTFDWDNMVCHKCIRSQQCLKTKNPLVGDKYCDDWDEPVENCSDTQF